MQTQGSLLKVHEEFQDGGNSIKPYAGSFLAPYFSLCRSTPVKLALTGEWGMVILHLWFSGAYLRHKPLRLHSQEQPLWRSFMALASTNKWIWLCSFSLTFTSCFYMLLYFCFLLFLTFKFSDRDRESERYLFSKKHPIGWNSHVQGFHGSLGSL